MGIRTVCAALVCKSSYHLLHLLHRGGTSLPGKLALKLDPNYLATMARGVKTIVVTGTNGKTTATHIIAQALANTEKSAFYNRSGANLIQGITTEFALRSTIAGKPKYAYAAIECDEGAFKTVCGQLQPAVVVVTNIFRDQLDRYGEVMHTRDNLLIGLGGAPKATLVLNADDSIVASLARELPNRCVYYGVDCAIYPQRVEDLSDATRCIVCGAPYEYDYVTYAHLGGFRCPQCGFSRVTPSISVTAITERRTNSCVIEVCEKATDSSRATITSVALDVPASYDVYNCIAVIAGLVTFGLARADAFAAVGKFKHGFGRSESFDIGGTKLRLMLMKNPAGCNQIINLLLNEPDKNMGLVCILNDQECDGTDVSWIYDAAWEAIAAVKNEVICSGKRAEDMALRLKYAGFPTQGIDIEKNYGRLVDKLKAKNSAVTVVANYSAMLEFRAVLAKRLGLAGFWEG